MNKILKCGAASGLVASLLPGAAYAGDVFGDVNLLVPFIVLFAIYAAVLIIGLALFIFWIVMLLDALKRTNWKQARDRTLWIVLLAIFGGIAPAIYYFAVKRVLDKKKRTAK